ncbi:hypothetical protein SmJEL517_g05733 [Synchytrium microbalum]|uniref:Tubulin-specific chaperone D C-terminal domain-containing protein n=1 Tax=Synchytrium microbalum TaxID=1806994 RepID=A0A507BY85_9FUNG|nr:uncharacterized protein SmJEL517_g05733 [Synchytrium microbalum]TPX30764.1 hypothetical protein SmJEL517_g05733 [Synchytrium microbalum]
MLVMSEHQPMLHLDQQYALNDQPGTDLLCTLIQAHPLDINACRRTYTSLPITKLISSTVMKALASRLRVPLDILSDEPDQLTKRDTYLILVSETLPFLTEIAAEISTISPDTELQLLVTAATFLADKEHRIWSSQQTHQLATQLLQSLSTNTRTLVAKHLVNILSIHVKPYFAHHPNIDKQELKQQPRNGDSKVTMTDFFQDQKWKSEYPESPFILAWCLLQVQQPELQKVQGLVIPTLLTLLDDFDPKYKTLGVQLTRHVIIDNTAPSEIRVTGLGDVFFDALITCLSYHSDPDLLEEAISTSLDLSSVIQVKGTEALHARYERITDVFTKGFLMSIGGKVRVIQIYLQTIPLLFEKIGVLGVQYLKQLLISCCEVLALQYCEVDTRTLATQAIASIINVGWPRIDAYRGSILSAIASAWKHEASSDNEMKDVLVALCTLLKKACGPEFENDLRFLLEIDGNLFTSLVTPSLGD